MTVGPLLALLPVEVKLRRTIFCCLAAAFAVGCVLDPQPDDPFQPGVTDSNNGDGFGTGGTLNVASGGMGAVVTPPGTAGAAPMMGQGGFGAAMGGALGFAGQAPTASGGQTAAGGAPPVSAAGGQAAGGDSAGGMYLDGGIDGGWLDAGPVPH